MERLKNLRISKGLTQKAVQQLTGIDQSNYSKIERGQRQMTVGQCLSLSIALETSMDYLIGRTEKAEPYPSRKK